jgi:aldose sugar dehydrogenase
MRHVRHLFCLAAFSAACNNSPEPGVTPNPTDIPVLNQETVVTGLNGGWDVALASDGAMFYTERCRGLTVRRADGTTTRLFGTSGSVLVASDLHCEGQSGVHGVALAPDFATSRNIYVYMTSSLSSPRTNRVVRLTLNSGYTTASSRTDIISDIAFKYAANAVAAAGAHSGGRIRFGPDGLLYVTTGDNHNAILPQSPTLLGGKVLRVTTTGAAAPGNSPPAGFDSRIFTYGHRNVQGISFRPGTGQAYISEHGPNHSDEVTALVNGGNGGWDPQNRVGLTCPDSYCGYAGNVTTMPMTDVTRFPNAIPPVWNNGGSSQGMGPAAFLDGPQWRAWNGRLAVAIMGSSRRLVILELNASGNLAGETNSSLPALRYRALTQGPDGNLYIVVDTPTNEIWRVTPSPGTP